MKCLGYEVAILSETGKVQESWQYEATELHWAKAGYKTLIGAQARGALDNRSGWKPYKPNCRVPHTPGTVRAAEVDGHSEKPLRKLPGHKAINCPAYAIV